MRVDVVRAIALFVIPLALALVALESQAGHVHAAGLTTFHVTVLNTTSPETGLTRGAYLIHEDAGAFWSPGARANQGVEDIAEYASPGAAVEQMGAVELERATLRGDSMTFEIRAAPGQYLSTVQMFSMTNDAFLGLESFALFSEAGTAMSSTVYLEAWDSGTEANTFEETGYSGESTDAPILPHPGIEGTQAIVIIEAYPAMLVAPGGGFLSWEGPERAVEEVFGGLPGIQLVWHWTGNAWEVWGEEPAVLRQSYMLFPGDVLFVLTTELMVIRT